MAPGTRKTEEEPRETACMDASYADLDPALRRLVLRNSQKGPFGLQAQIVWRNVWLLLVLHVLAVVGALVGAWATWKSWIFYLFWHLYSGIGVTAGAHRLWTHKTYKARLPLQIFLMLGDCIAMQNDILEWSRDHRVHHKFTETDADPHNAKRGFFFAHIGWLLLRKHPDVLIKGRAVDMSDLKRDPVVMFQHRHYLKLCFLMTLVLPTFIPWYFWGENFWIAFFVLFAFRYVLTLHSTWLVNSAAHMWGSRQYDKNSNPADNLFVSIATGGEGFHNYHHVFPHDYSTSEWGPSLNMGTIIIDFFATLGLAYDRKQVSQEAIERVRRRIGDLSADT